jgi:hypothetical protein
MDAETAIRRVSFAEAQHSSAEAMAAMAQQRLKLAETVPADEAALVTELTDRTAEAERHQVDKTA